MKIDVVWDDSEKTVLRFWRHEGWTVDDYFQSIDVALEMLKHHPHKVHMIQDATETGSMPPKALEVFGKGNKMLAPYAAESVIVGDSRMLEFIFQMFKSMNMDISEHFILANTLDEAREKLSKFPIERDTA